jgi:SAM-dependent methyltransferase
VAGARAGVGELDAVAIARARPPVLPQRSFAELAERGDIGVCQDRPILTALRAPLPIGWAVRRVRELVDPLTARNSAVPPRRLRARTGAPGATEFLAGGATAARELAAARPPAQAESILDLGCGSARVLPHIASLAGDAQCTGCDVDPAAIAWAAAHHPELRWVVSGFEPPLPFEAGSFDFVYSISVFSHLDEALGDAWMREVARLLKPGGTALLSVHGGHAFEQFRTGAVTTNWCPRSAFARPPLGPDEFVFVPYQRSIWNQGELPGVGESYGLAFHGEQYLRSRWSPALTIVEVRPRAITAWQDLVVCTN